MLRIENTTDFMPIKEVMIEKESTKLIPSKRSLLHVLALGRRTRTKRKLPHVLTLRHNTALIATRRRLILMLGTKQTLILKRPIHKHTV